MNRNSKNIITRAIKSYRTWLEKNRDQSIEFAPVYIKKSFDLDDFGAIKTLPISLSDLANVFGSQGCLDILDEKPAGWQFVGRSLAYHEWAIRLCAEAFFRQAFLGKFRDVVNLTAQLSTIANMLCSAIVRNRSKSQLELTQTMLRAFTVPDAVSDVFWRVSRFEPFVLQLLHKVYGQHLPNRLEAMDMRVFGPVLQHWDEPTELSAAIVRVCDYHCRNIFDRGRKDRPPEFMDSPFALIPFEVLAIYKLRDSMGLETPAVEHPILMTPLAKVDCPSLEFAGDELTDRVQRLFNNFFATDM
jgi:hypothetical protein